MSVYAEQENRCVCCGEIIPEGRQVCFACERGKENKGNQGDSEEDWWSCWSNLLKKV